MKDRDVVGDERAKGTNRKASRLELPRRGWIDDRDADAVGDQPTDHREQFRRHHHVEMGRRLREHAVDEMMGRPLPRHADKGQPGHQFRRDEFVGAQCVILGQDGHALHAIAGDVEPGRIDRQLGDADIDGARGEHAAHQIRIASEELDPHIRPPLNKGGDHRRQQCHTCHRMTRHRQRADLSLPDMLCRTAEIVDSIECAFDFGPERDGLGRQAQAIARARE